MAQVLPPRLNVESCPGEVFPPPDVPLGPMCALKWTQLSDECGAEEARTALVASYRHASRTFVCPFKQWQQQQKYLSQNTEQNRRSMQLRALLKYCGTGQHDHHLKTAAAISLSHLYISSSQTFLLSDAQNHFKSHIQAGMWRVLRDYETTHVREPEAHSDLQFPSPLHAMEKSVTFPVSCWK